MLGENQLRVLSVRQPWADLLISGDHIFEPRTFRTNYRGWTVIQSTLKADPCRSPFPTLYRSMILGLPLGTAIGVAYLEECHPAPYWLSNPDTQSAALKHPGLKKRGMYGWKFSKQKRFPKPIPHKGGRNLQPPTPALIAAANLAIHGFSAVHSC